MVVCNDSEQDIVLKKRQVVADIFVFQTEYDMKQVFDLLACDSGSVTDEKQNESFVNTCSVHVDACMQGKNVHSAAENVGSGEISGQCSGMPTASVADDSGQYGTGPEIEFKLVRVLL